MSVAQLLLRPTVIGHVLTLAHLDPQAVVRFSARASRVGPDEVCGVELDGEWSGCLMWPGARNSDGYGIVRVTPKGWNLVQTMTVHRLAERPF